MSLPFPGAAGHSSARRPAAPRRVLAAVVVALVLLAAPFAGAADRPVLLGLVLDTSGSVGPQELARTRELGVQVLASLPAGSEVAIYTFDDESRVVLPRTSRTAAVAAALASIHVAGRKTALYDALFDASRDLQSTPGMARALLLVTDGKDEDSSLALEDGLKLAQQARIPVFAVGVGRVQERTLRRIAKLTGGSYEPVAQARPAALAQRIVAAAGRDVAEAPAAPASAAPRTTAAAEPPPSLRTAAGSAAPAVPVETSGHAGWWLGGLLLLAIAGAAVLVLRGRDTADHHCPVCRRPLAGALSQCVYCAAGEAGPRRAAPAVAPAAAAEGVEYEEIDDASPTVVEGYNQTEEFLEKTVTLREKPVLLLTNSAGTTTVWDLRRESATSIGRSKANDVILQDVTVSSQHCRVRPMGEGFEVLDLRSTNGTFVNEERVQRHPLKEGDELRVGDVVLRFRKQHTRS
jgi:hypothetical protein